MANDAIEILRELVKTENGRARLKPHLDRLRPRQERVIRLRIGLTETGDLVLTGAGGLTQERTGETLPMSVGRSRVGQIENMACRKLRAWDSSLFQPDSQAQ